MVRQTQYQGYDVPESGDPDYFSTLDTLFDAIDTDVLIKDTSGARPSSPDDEVWFLATDDDPPTLSYFDGDQWHGIGGQYELPDNVAMSDAEEVITEIWEFSEPIVGDITGHASSADQADYAVEAGDADRLGGDPASDYTRADVEETVQERWAFEADQLFLGRVQIVQGAINLPQHDGSNPSSSQLLPGSFWFRLDDQPTS